LAPRSKTQLIYAVQQAWDSIPNETIKKYKTALKNAMLKVKRANGSN